MDINKARMRAEREIKEEDFEAAVKDCKIKLRTKKSFFDKVFPWKISITRK